MAPYLHVSRVKHVGIVRNYSRSFNTSSIPESLGRKGINYCSKNGLRDKLLNDAGANKLAFLARLKPIDPTYNGLRRLNSWGEQALAHEHASIARSILKRSFGYDDFRHEQAAAISTILRGENALVVFPTGAGKSLCYQIPAIAFEELDNAGLTNRRPGIAAMGPGITIVVSPLIALMKDQVDDLQRRGISAACLDSTKTMKEQRDINTSILEGRLRLLYCTPEKLNSTGFVESMKRIPGGVRLVAIDEAHCISEWGHSFRPDYLKIARFAKEIEAERVIGLTATATPRVAEDICKFLDIRESNLFRTSAYRPNLELKVEVIRQKREKLRPLLEFLDTHHGPTLIYVTARDRAEILAANLRNEGYDAAYFHSKISTRKKMQTQEAFMAGSVRIMVATIAFGMGIDKADIRNVVNYDIPSSIEEYSQQIGRAGRDGNQSSCMLYICRDDFWLKEYFAQADLPSRHSIQGLLEDIFLNKPTFKLPGNRGRLIKLNEQELEGKHDVTGPALSIILAKIELHFGLIRAITPEFKNYLFEAPPEYRNHIEHDDSPEAKAIASYSTSTKKWQAIDVNAIARDFNLVCADIMEKLNEFNNSGFIRLKGTGLIQRYQVLKQLPSTRQEIEKLANQLYTEMEYREKEHMKRFNTICSLLTDSKCFAWALTRYFGMDLPGGKSRCGHCTYCLTGEPALLPPKPETSIDSSKIRAIQALCDVRDDPRFLARVAFGIASPKIVALGFNNPHYMFGSLKEHSFKSLLKEFTKACEAS
ncbi:ATP-dependent DNA helicase recQ [Xylaria bambusicola]|uniref:ATP-dependent DNA helicase recQ n=1 Tax=Xylaria bambusicola TaxID=326684 RepID=UPI002008052F|nr:ATP-dependent DNA helicase recQ [Xylaria bambusicola]KAI0527953.1 ATP-dependent DNA helicase recQ [Xylaria bambusicola]